MGLICQIVSACDNVKFVVFDNAQMECGTCSSSRGSASCDRLGAAEFKFWMLSRASREASLRLTLDAETLVVSVGWSSSLLHFLQTLATRQVASPQLGCTRDG